MTRQHDPGKDEEAKHEASDAHHEQSAPDVTSHDELPADKTLAHSVEQQDTAPRRRVPWLLGAGIIALMLLGGFGWSLYQYHGAQQHLTQLNEALEALKNRSVEQRALTQAISPLQDQLHSVDERLGALQKRLDDHRTPDGRYIEIDYQLRMALQRLALNRDIHGTLELLNSADQRITELNDPVFLPVRESIQSAIAAVNNVKAPDVDGLYLQLAAESRALDDLPMSQPVASFAPERQAGDAAQRGDAQPSWWRRQLSRVGHEMKALVVVRYNDQALDQLLMPEQEGAVREHLRLAFTEAQIGLLNQSSTVYTQALHHAVDTLQRYFPQGDARVKSVIERINALAQQPIRPELPDVTGVLQQWQHAVERRHAQQTGA